MAKIDHAVLVVRSITSAMRGQKILERNGISAQIQRNTLPSSAQGCGYALRISGSVETALALLSDAGVTVSEVRGG